MQYHKELSKEDFLKLIKECPTTHYGTITGECNKHNNLMQFLIEATSYLELNVSVNFRLKCFKSEFTEQPKCKNCQKLLFSLKEHCSKSCSATTIAKRPDVKAAKVASIKNWYLTADDIIKKERYSKARKTCLEKYGVDHNFKTKETKEKRNKTWLANYGEDNPNKAQKIKDKIISTNNKKYGANSPLLNTEIKQKSLDTLMKNWGVTSPLKSKELMNKQRESSMINSLIKYGTEYPAWNTTKKMEIIEKMDKNRSLHYKEYVLPSGKIIKVQGYETGALDNLIKEFKEDDIFVGVASVNKIDHFIWIDNDNITHSYYPDIFIKTENTFYEVKSEYFFNKNYSDILAKAKSIVDKGYGFYFLISNDNINFKKINYNEAKTYKN